VCLECLGFGEGLGFEIGGLEFGGWGVGFGEGLGFGKGVGSGVYRAAITRRRPPERFRVGVSRARRAGAISRLGLIRAPRARRALPRVRAEEAGRARAPGDVGAAHVRPGSSRAGYARVWPGRSLLESLGLRV